MGVSDLQIKKLEPMGVTRMSEAFLARMPLEAWTELQAHFSTMFIAQGAPTNCALFVRTDPRGEAEVALFAPPDQLPFYAAPDEWKSGPATGDGWALLVGAHDAAERFGVTLKSRRD